jgi:hypothetical protein
VYWTKFECISGKIRRILTTNRTRGARGGLKLPRTLRLRCDANQCASDTLVDSRVQKPKNFLAFFSRLLPPPLRREAEKEMERKFLVLLRRFSLRKEHYHFITFGCSFLRPHGDRGALLSAFGGNSKLCAFDGGSTNSSKWSLAIQNSLRNGEAQILYVFAPPSRAHTSSLTP